VHCVKLEQYPNNELRLTSYPLRVGGFSYEPETSTRPEPAPASPPLTLPTISEPSPKSGFGGLPSPTKFGLRGRRTILRAGGALDKSGAKPEEMVFLTGTLPGDTPEAKVAIAAWSGFIVDRLKSWLSKYWRDRHEFYSWEHQQREALHIHWCCWIPDETVRKKVIERFHDQWCRLLELVSEKAEVDLFRRDEHHTWRGQWEVVQTTAEECYNSVAAYVSKYCSKGDKKAWGRGQCPSRWWGVSRPLMALLRSLTTVKEYVCTNVNAAKKWWDENCHRLEENCHTIHSYKSKSGLCCVRVGYHSPAEFESIRNSLKGDLKVKNGWLNKENETEFVGDWMNEPLSEIIAISTRAEIFTEATRKQIVKLVFEGQSAWDASTLVRLHELIVCWTFMDVVPATPYYRKVYPNFDPKTFSTLCWSFCRDLRLAYDRFYSPLTIDSYRELEDHLQVEISGEVQGQQVFHQADLFGFRNDYEACGIDELWDEKYGCTIDTSADPG